MAPLACAHCAKLADAVRELIEVMEIQEKRMTGEFHIPNYTMAPIWNDAKLLAREALIDTES